MSGKIVYRVVDTPTPRFVMFSARFKRSNAYKEIQEHLPVMITQIIDSLSRNREVIIQKYGEECLDELKSLIGNLAHLKYQLQTNKDFNEFTGNESDKELWNNFIKSLPVGSGSFFRTSFIYAQCYLYRKISSFFENTSTLYDFDYFEKQKRINLESHHAHKLVQILRNLEYNENIFQYLLKLSMWGNRCQSLLDELDDVDLSNKKLKFLDCWNTFIVANEYLHIWLSLTEYMETKSPLIVDIVCNETGLELLIDLFLAEYLIEKKLATKVRFHLKAIPWFVMQATVKDIDWLLNYLENSLSRSVTEKVHYWKELFLKSKFVIAPIQSYWTSPYEYYKMREIDPKLYKYLAEAHLIIFKGDLNYRKLIGDYFWEPRDKFISCIQGFQPTNICALRVMESDAICGLDSRRAEDLRHTNVKLLISGRYGVIQYAEGNECGCGLD